MSASGLALVALVLSSVAPGARLGGNTAAQDIAWFNAQREANGIPAGITENPEWSSACDQHITYLQKSGSSLRHDEDHTSPYYTAAGEWGGMHSVLSQGDTWGADYNPWETAPIHLAQLMSPRLSEMGVADRDRYVCATTWPGMNRPLPTTTSVVTYPGDGTTTYASEDPAESPFTPEDIVGLSGATGPNLYAYLWGPLLGNWRVRIAVQTASLTGPEGDVPLKWVDSTTDRVGPYLPQGCGILMPVHPLQPGTRYTASVTFSDGTSHEWHFTTRKSPPPNPGNLGSGAGGSGARVSQDPADNHTMIRFRLMNGRVIILASSDAPITSLTLSYHGQPLKVRALALGISVRAVVPTTPLQHGAKACLTSGGGTSGYKPARLCKTY